MLRDKGYEVDVGGWQLPPPRDELKAALSGTQWDAAITLLTDQIDAEVMDAAPHIKMFANYAVGFNNFDLEAAKARGVVMTNTPGGYSFCIAEHAIALMLALTTRLVEADDYVRSGGYKGWDPMLFIGTDLRGGTLGLVGVGHIGTEVAHMAIRGIGMKVVYSDVVRNESLEKEYGALYVDNIDDVLAQADVVSLHVPLLDSTRHLIDERRLSLMKRTAFLVNTARGPVIDEIALVKALKEGVIRGAGLDVFEFEPNLAEGLKELPNVVLTPHIASARESARDEMSTLAAQNVIDFLEGREPRNKVSV